MNNTTTSFTKEQLIERCSAEIECAQITIRNGGSDTPHAVEARLRLYEIALVALESNDAQPVEPDANGWEIDMSCGRPILTYKNCSVIEGDDALYAFNVLSAAERTMTIDGGTGSEGAVPEGHILFNIRK